MGFHPGYRCLLITFSILLNSDQAFERLIHLSNRTLNLENLLSVVLIGINTVSYLIIGSYILYVSGVDLSAMVVTFATAFASLKFAFYGMITRIFESMIWVFVTKAVEVGDLILVFFMVST